VADPRSVLVVDDEPLLLASMARMLRRHGLRVEAAGNGLEGLEKAMTWRPDWIVSDVRMPVMDGPTMVRQLRARGLDHVRIAFLSGYNDVTAAELEELGVERVLAKPMSSAALLAILDSGTHDAH
jgi:two-component system, OmpR family, response regulator